MEKERFWAECFFFSLSPQDHELISHWVHNIKNVQRLHQEELAQIEDEEAKVRRLVELNVVEQVTP